MWSVKKCCRGAPASFPTHKKRKKRNCVEVNWPALNGPETCRGKTTENSMKRFPYPSAWCLGIPSPSITSTNPIRNHAAISFRPIILWWMVV
jgi:hypothetical protein